MTPQQKAQAQLDLQEKQLKAKEEYLNQIEPGLKKAEQKLKTVEANILVRQNHLDTIVKKHKKYTYDVEILEDLYDEKRRKAERKLDELKEATNGMIDRQTDVRNETQKLIKERKALEDSVKELKVYQNKQDELINQAISDGNEQLLELKHQIDKMHGAKKRIERELTLIEELKTEYDYKLSLSKIAFESNSNKFIIEQDNMQERVLDLNKQIHKAYNELEQIKAETAKQAKILQERETAVIAKQDQQAEERSIFETEKRRWNSARGV